eukprot:1696863-Rhodomonas_salina.5
MQRVITTAVIPRYTNGHPVEAIASSSAVPDWPYHRTRMSQYQRTRRTARACHVRYRLCDSLRVFRHLWSKLYGVCVGRRLISPRS